MPIKLKGLLVEAMEKLFHATELHTLLEILKSDSLKFTYADGTESETSLSKGYPFYLSTSREKYGGYARSGNYPAVLVLNGPAIKSAGGIKMISTDYWGNTGGSKNLEHNETEERILSQKQMLSGLKKYLFEIFIFIDEDRYNPEKESPAQVYIKIKNVIYPLIDAAKSSGIPCYFYIGDTKSKAFAAYKIQRKELSHDAEYVKNYFEQLEKNSEKLKQFLSTAAPEELVPYRRNEEYFKQDIAELEFVSKVISEPELYAKYDHPPENERNTRILRYFTNYTDDLVPQVSATVHNMRSKHPEIFRTLAKSIRKYRYKNLKDALKKTSNILIALRFIENIWSDTKLDYHEKLYHVSRSYILQHSPEDKKEKILNILKRYEEKAPDTGAYMEIANLLR